MGEQKPSDDSECKCSVYGLTRGIIIVCTPRIDSTIRGVRRNIYCKGDPDGEEQAPINKIEDSDEDGILVLTAKVGNYV